MKIFLATKTESSILNAPMNNKTKWYLGKLKGTGNRLRNVYLEDFSWDCNWYWGGGYIGNADFHAHFDGAFLNVPDYRGHCLGNFVPSVYRLPEEEKKRVKVLSNGAALWESLSFFLDDAQYTEGEWWRIKDLFKQFYALREAAEVFQHGGHCTSAGRTTGELNKAMADQINNHIKTVIIPAVHNALNRVEWKAEQEAKRAKEAELTRGANI